MCYIYKELPITLKIWRTAAIPFMISFIYVQTCNNGFQNIYYPFKFDYVNVLYSFLLPETEEWRPDEL